MLEIEIKAYCEDLKVLEKKILSIGGKYYKKINEHDIYYRHPSRDFAKTDEAFRIRIEDGAYKFTYKGPKFAGKAKIREEVEAGFMDIDSMKIILSRLGFVVAEEIIKTRIVYGLNGCEICLDSVDGVGEFVELEKIGEERGKNESELFALAAGLGLSKFERKSYLEMKLEKKST